MPLVLQQEGRRRGLRRKRREQAQEVDVGKRTNNALPVARQRHQAGRTNRYMPEAPIGKDRETWEVRGVCGGNDQAKRASRRRRRGLCLQGCTGILCGVGSGRPEWARLPLPLEVENGTQRRD